LQEKLRLSSKDARYLIAFFIIITVTVSALVYLEVTPSPTNQFFSMWVLGSSGLTESYFPADNPNLYPGESVNWTLGVYNHMSSLEYVVLRVKLLNATETGPNEENNVPSPTPEIYEFERVLVDNETWSIPFVWTVMNVTSAQGYVIISGLQIDGTSLTGNLAEAIGGFNYRLVFELWFYDPTTNNLTFSWSTNSTSYSVWAQLWFNATAV